LKGLTLWYALGGVAVTAFLGTAGLGVSNVVMVFSEAKTILGLPWLRADPLKEI